MDSIPEKWKKIFEKKKKETLFLIDLKGFFVLLQVLLFVPTDLFQEE